MDISKLFDLVDANGDLHLTIHLDAPAQRPARPYDPVGRIKGREAIAQHIGKSISFVSSAVRDGRLKTYRIGRDIYAYTDEITMV